MKNFKFLIVGFLAVSLVFIGCGGGGGSSSSSSSQNVNGNASGTAQLGYISGGDVKLYVLSDLDNYIAITKSSTSTDQAEAGSFIFENIALDANKYYLVEISNGKDIDPNDDGKIESGEAVDLNGTIHALAKGEDLTSGDVRLNALTDMAYQKLKGSLSSLSSSQIDTKLTETAQEYLYDIDGDGVVSQKDLLKFDPIKNRDKTKKSYKDILDIYVPKLHSGADEDDKLVSLMYLDNPRIVIKNGALQEVPFNLEVSIENKPENTTVKWYLDDIEKASINEQISNDGAYLITAKIYKGTKLLKTISSRVIATKKVEIASIDVDISKDNIVFVTDDSNSSLAGAKVTIPKGALKTNTKITIKKSSMNIIPNTDGISISDVIVMEPSGLKFDKPVQIRIPYNKNIDIENQTIRIARYSDGGKIDYIEPLFVDKDTHEVVFETEHFTEFKAEKSHFYETADEKFINALNQEFPSYGYDIDDWKPILNVEVTKSITVYDVVIDYFKNKEIVDTIDNATKKWQGLASAYRQLYGNPEIMKEAHQRWNNVKEGFDNLKYISVITSFKDGIKEGIKSAIGLPNMSGETVADEFLDYDEYIFNQGDKAFLMYEDIVFGLQIENYFDLKNMVPTANGSQLRKELYSTKGITEESVKISGENFDVDSRNGWFYMASYSAAIEKEGVPSDVWEKIDTMFSLYHNFKTKKYDSDYNPLSSKDVVKMLIDKAVEYTQNNGEYIYLNGCRSSLESNQILMNEKVVMDIKCSLSASSQFNYNFYIYKADNYYGKEIKNISVQKMSDTNYKISFTPKQEGRQFYYLGYARFELNTNNAIYQSYEGSSYSSNQVYVKAVKQQAKVIGLNINGELNSNGDFEVDLEGTFDVGSLAHTIEVDLPNHTEYTKHFTIQASDFNNTALTNVSVLVKPNSDVLKSYEISPTYKTINIKAKIDRALDGVVDNTLPSVKIIKVNGVSIPEANQNDAQTIDVGDSVTYSINGSNLKYIFTGGLSCSVKSGDLVSEHYVYECSYDTPNVYEPYVKVVLKGARDIQKINAPTVSVMKVGNTIPTINLPQDTKVYEANERIYLNAEVSDTDGYIVATKWTPLYNNLNVVNSNSATGAYVVAPKIIDNELEYKFKVTTTDNQGAQETAIRTVKVHGDISTKRELKFVEDSTLKDSCGDSYFHSGCGYEITTGDTALKIWKFKNTGNVDFEDGLQFVLINDDSNQVSLGSPRLIATSSDLSVGGEIKIAVTVNFENALNGEYGARWLIKDSEGNTIKMPNGNDAQMWLKIQLNRASEPILTLSDLLVGKTVYQNFCGDIDSLEFRTDGTILNIDSDGHRSTNNYRIDGNTVYITSDGEEKTITLIEQTSEYVKMSYGATMYFSESVAKQYPDNSECDKDNSDVEVSFIHNGTSKTTTDVMINMDAQSCPQLQVNIKENYEDGADIIQFTTNYHSKESFDNAFSNNKLTLNSDALSFYLEQGGASQAINDTSTFSVTFTKNSDGSYDIESTGYFANKYEDGENRVSDIVAKNVDFDTHHGYGDNTCGNDTENNEAINIFGIDFTLEKDIIDVEISDNKLVLTGTTLANENSNSHDFLISNIYSRSWEVTMRFEPDEDEGENPNVLDIRMGATRIINKQEEYMEASLSIFKQGVSGYVDFRDGNERAEYHDDFKDFDITQYHTYKIQWTDDDKIKYYIDSKEVFSTNIPKYDSIKQSRGNEITLQGKGVGYIKDVKVKE